jgi:hypothetical protein
MATGSLLGRADTSLIQAATSAERAKGPIDMSPVHERLAQAHRARLQATAEMFGGIFDAAEAMGKSLVQKNKERKTTTDTFKNSLPEKKPSGDYVYDFGKDEKISGWNQTIKDLQEQQDKGDVNQKKIDRLNKKIDKRTGRLEKTSDQPSGLFFTNSDEKKENINVRNIEGQIKYIRKTLKGKENKEERQTQIDNLRKSAVGFTTFQETTSALLESEDINFKASGADNLEFLKAINNNGEPLENGNRAIMGFTDKGKMVFTYVDKNGNTINDKNGKPFSADMATIQDYVVAKNPEVRGGIELAIDPKPHADRGKRGLEYNAQSVNNAVDLITDRNSFRDAATTKKFTKQGSGISASLADTLIGIQKFDDNGVAIKGPTLLSDEVYSVLNQLGNKKDYDNNDDGDVDEKDFVNEANYSALVKQILSGNDLKLSKVVLKQHLNNEMRRYHEEELKIYITKNPDSDAAKRRAALAVKEEKVVTDVASGNKIGDTDTSDVTDEDIKKHVEKVIASQDPKTTDIKGLREYYKNPDNKFAIVNEIRGTRVKPKTAKTAEDYINEGS